MNPNGFVEAASITSFTSRSIRWQRTFSSFTSAMFTLRNTFSRIFVISATRVDETGTTRSNDEPYSASAASRHAGVRPPTTFGME